MNIVQIGTNIANDDLTKIIGKNEPDKLILVEPLSIHNEKIKECYDWIKNYHIENVIISDKNEKIKFYYHELDKPRYELSSISVDHILKHNYNLNGIIELNIESLNINNLFDKYNLINIDILFIDAEGLDDNIIRNIDFNKYNIKKIYFENLHLKSDIHNFLINKGYLISKKNGENGWTDIAIKYNVKLIHILNNINGYREKKSIDSLSKLQDIGINYIQQVLPLYKGNLWKTPSVSGYKTSPGHYGVYESYKKAINDNFTDDIDALIVCECDSILDINLNDFLIELDKTLNFCNKYDIYQFSWGGGLVNNFEQGNVLHIDNEYSDYLIVSKIILAHFNIFPKNSRDFYLEKINKLGWDSADIWLNKLLYKNKKQFKQAISSKTLAHQIEGISYIDNVLRKPNIHNYDFFVWCDIDNNKIYIKYKNEINVNISIFEYIEFKKTLLYKKNFNFNNTTIWISTYKELKNIKNLYIKIEKDNNIIYYKYIEINDKKIEFRKNI